LIETFHTQELIHRDIKPGNFLVGLGKHAHDIYLIDYGLSKPYINLKTRGHIPFRMNVPLTGTIRYASLSTHLTYEQGRRDDLESLAYTLVYFIKGRLPWQNLGKTTYEENLEAIKETKMETSEEALCSGLPKELLEFTRHIKSLEFEDKPDYGLLKKLFKDCFARHGFARIEEYEWELIKHDADKHVHILPNNNNSLKVEGRSKDEEGKELKKSSVNQFPPYVAAIAKLYSKKSLTRGKSANNIIKKEKSDEKNTEEVKRPKKNQPKMSCFLMQAK